MLPNQKSELKCGKRNFNYFSKEFGKFFQKKMGNILTEHSLFIFYFHISAKCGTQKKKKKEKHCFVIGPRSL
jgi:hypothetical protein